MIKRKIIPYGSNETKGRDASRKEQEAITYPQIHMLIGSTNSGKSVVAANLADEYARAHARAHTKPPPDLVVYTGAGESDPVYDEVRGSKRAKVYSNKQEQEFIDDILSRYARASKAKKTTITKDDNSRIGRGGSAATTQEMANRLAAADKGEPEGSGDNTHRHTFVIVDDAAGSSLLPARIQQSPIALAIQGHRHADMSFAFTGQRLGMFPVFIRANASSMMLWPPRSSEEQKVVEREANVSRESLRRGFAVANSEGPHSFLHVDVPRHSATLNFSGEPV